MNGPSRYAAAVLVTALAVAIRWPLEPWIGSHVPFATLYGAVAAAVWFGGVGPAVLVVMLGYMACRYLLIEPRGVFLPDSIREWLALGLYLSSCGIIIGFGHGMRLARRQAEAGQKEALQRQAELELEVAKRQQVEQELRCSEASLRDADRRKDEFLATLAHELRNPLAPIRNGLQLLRMCTDDPATSEKARCIVERQVEQLVRLVDDLLDISRIKGGKLELRKLPLDLNVVLQNAVEVSRSLIDGGGHELELQLPAAPIYVDGDVVRLTQAVANLLNNAAKYSERCGRIRLTLDRRGNDAVINVTDSGIGMTAEQLRQVFGMFTQVHGSPQQFQGGLGIGLALVSRIVEMHGGSIEAKSDGPRQGCCFTITLPTIEYAVPETTSITPAAKIFAPRSLRILVVDDNQDAADTLTKMLRVVGNEVKTAYDGEQAVVAATEFEPDVIFLDIGLPKIDGYEAARRIRQLPFGEKITLVALTGWGQEEDKRRSQAAGFNRHLVKPPDFKTVTQVLTEAQASLHR